MALNTLYNGIDAKVFEQIKDLEMASEVCTRLEETYEGTSTVKSAKLYHYTTTPELAPDDLTPKAAIASDDLTLKTYSVSFLLTQ
jgi:hypothetical protein